MLIDIEHTISEEIRDARERCRGQKKTMTLRKIKKVSRRKPRERKKVYMMMRNHIRLTALEGKVDEALTGELKQINESLQINEDRLTELQKQQNEVINHQV